MPNSRSFDHRFNGRFRVEIDGLVVGTFSACGGLEARVDVVDFTDGDGVLARKRPGRARFSNIVLRRGMTTSDDLWKWFNAGVNGQVARRSGSIIVCDDAMQEVLRYNFFEGWPCRWKGLELNADTPGALVEEVEIAVEKIERA